MEKLLGFLILAFIIAFIVGFVGFMFSIHWTIGIIGIFLVCKVI